MIAAPLLLMFRLMVTDQVLFWGLPALQFIPWRIYLWENLRQGILPLWNSLNGMGAPFLANYQLAFFYPPSWLLYLLAAVAGPSAIAWGHSILVFLHLVWAGLGTASLLRRVGVGRLGQTVGGLAFGLCGYFIARSGVFPMIWTGAWLPWVILASSKVAIPGEKGGLKAPWIIAPLILSLTMMLLAGHAQLAWYIILLAGAWVVVGGWSQGGAKLALAAAARFAIALLFAVMLSSIQLLPTAEYLLHSQRSAAVDYELGLTYSFWPWRLLVFLAPNMFGNPGSADYWGYAAFWEDAVYMGVLPFLMALSTISALKRRKDQGTATNRFSGLIRFFWMTIVIAGILALGKNTPVFPFLYRFIPTFNMFQAPSRYMIAVEFSLAMLAGLGIETWCKPYGRKLDRLKKWVVAAAAVTLGAGAAAIFLQSIKATFTAATAMAGIWAFGSGLLLVNMPRKPEDGKRKIWEVAVITWVALDLLIAGFGLLPSAASSLYANASSFSADIQKIAGNGRVYLSMDEEYRIKFSRFFRFSNFAPLENWGNLRATLLPNMNLLDGISSTTNFDPMIPARYARFMKYVELLPPDQKKAWFNIMNVKAVEQIDITTIPGVKFDPIVESKRWYLASCPIFAKSEKESWDLLTNKLSGASDAKGINWVILEADPQNQRCESAGTNAIQLMDEEPQKLEFRVDTDKAGWLVLSDTWYPGWTATVDGHEASILHANYLFRGVVVSQGEHVVVFKYIPWMFRLGGIISGFGWVLLAGLYIFKRIAGNIRLFPA